MADPLTARPAASIGKSRAVLPSASDDEVGGFHARLREQLYERKG